MDLFNVFISFIFGFISLFMVSEALYQLLSAIDDKFEVRERSNESET